jgi:xylulokinase
MDTLRSAGAQERRLVAVGGGTKARLWTQIVSDVTGRPQDVPEQTIGASYGDAMLAAIGTGNVPDALDWARVAHSVQPDPAAAGLYDEMFGAYVSLYPATAEHMHVLAAIQTRGGTGTVAADPLETSDPARRPTPASTKGNQL